MQHAVTISASQLKQIIEDAFDAGFEATHEGGNAEHHYVGFPQELARIKNEYTETKLQELLTP